MKIEKLYENLNRYVSTLDDTQQAAVKKMAETAEVPVFVDSLGLLASILRDVRAEIATASAKSSGRRGALAAARRIIRQVAKGMRDNWAGAWTGKDGRQYICSGFHGVALSETLDLPQVEGSPQIEDCILGTNERGEKNPLPLPTAGQVKAHIKISKAEGRTEGSEKLVIWDFGPGFPMVNAQYLLDVLELLPEATAAYVGETAPIYFHSPAGEGILLPIRPMERPREVTADRYNPVPASVPKAEPMETAPEGEEVSANKETLQSKTPEAEEAQKMKTGDIVEITGAYFKTDNGLYVVTHSPGDPGWCGADHSLTKITKAGKISTAKGRIGFWPIMSTVSSRAKTAEANTWNKAHAEIHPAAVKNMVGVIAYFQEKADGTKEQADWHARSWGEENPETQRLRTIQAFYESVAQRLGQGCPENPPVIPEQASQENPQENCSEIPEQAAPENLGAAVEAEMLAGREYIDKIMEQHPVRPGQPVVKIRWSEHPAFYSWEDDALELSPAAAEIILAHYDEARAADGKPGYDKTKFLITWTDSQGEEHGYEGRYDLGDLDGGLVAHIRASAASYCKNRLNLDPQEAEGTANRIDALADRLQACLATQSGDIVSVSCAPWLEALAEKRRQDARDFQVMIDMLTDEQLEGLVQESASKDKNIARFFLQVLFRRDQKKALELWKHWNTEESS